MPLRACSTSATCECLGTSTLLQADLLCHEHVRDGGLVTGVLPASAIFMGVYEPIKQHVEKRVPDNRQFLASLSGGLGAGLAASVVRVPTEVVKQRMQNGAAHH